jgi:protein TonB
VSVALTQATDPKLSKPFGDLFASLVISVDKRQALPRVGWQVSIALHALVVIAFVTYYLVVPNVMPDHPDYVRALLWDPPPPPPPPLPKGSSLRDMKEPPRPVTENPRPTDPSMQVPIEVPLDKPAKPETGVREEDQAGSPTGSEGGVPEGMEGGVEGGVVGGVLGGVIGGVVGGTGTIPVMDYEQAPRPIKITRPLYPQEAFIKKVEGTVTVEIVIDAAGNVVSARVVKSVPLLDAAAIQTVYQWRFMPAMKQGRAVASIAHAPVTFRIY